MNKISEREENRTKEQKHGCRTVHVIVEDPPIRKIFLEVKGKSPNQKDLSKDNTITKGRLEERLPKHEEGEPNTVKNDDDADVAPTIFLSIDQSKFIVILLIRRFNTKRNAIYMRSLYPFILSFQNKCSTALIISFMN